MPDLRNSDLMRIHKQFWEYLLSSTRGEAEISFVIIRPSLVETVEQKDRAEPLKAELLHPIWIGLPSGHH